AMNVVRRLCRGPERQLAVGTKVGDGRMLLEREMCVSFVKEEVLVYPVGFGKSLLDVTKLHRDELVEVSAVAVLVDPRLRPRARFLDGRDGRERLVLDLDRVERVERRVFIDRGHGRNRVAHIAHLVGCEGVLVLGDGEDPEGNRKVTTCRDGNYSGHRQGPRS